MYTAYKQQLLEIVREPKESLQAFCKRVVVVANKAYQDSAGEREKAGVLAIVRGCRSDMVKYAALANTFQAETIDDQMPFNKLLIWKIVVKPII